MASSEDVQMSPHPDSSPLSDLTSDVVQSSPSTVASSVRSTRRHKVINYSELNSGRIRDDDDNEMEGIEEEHEDEDELDDEEEEAPRPAKKKAKTANKKTPNKKKSTAKTNTKKKTPLRGKAKEALRDGFQNAPLDVILAIATHLDLKALLSLTRTCRVTRSLVLEPSSAPIWAQAREREGIPKLTSGALSEVELARLLYDKHCHACGKGQATKVDYILLKRGCAKCWKANVRMGINHTNLHPRTLECISTTDDSDYGYRYSVQYWSPDAVKMSTKLKELDLDSQEGKDFVKDQIELSAKRSADGRAIRAWFNRVQRDKDYAASQAMQDRRQQIWGRLQSLGYSRTYMYRTEFANHKFLKSKAELTDTSFEKALPELREILDGYIAKEDHAKAVLQESTNATKLRADYDKLKAKFNDELGLFPPFADYLDLDSIKPLWSADNDQTDSKGKQSAEPAPAVVEKEITVLCNKIKDAVYREVIEAHAKAEFLPGGASKAGFDVEAAEEDEDKVLLNRVTSAISCPYLGCPVFATFPAILDHACTDHVLRSSYDKAKPYKFSETPLTTSGETVAGIRMILGAAGEREMTATVETLEELSWRLTCKDCPKAHELSLAGPPKPKPKPPVVVPPAPVTGPMDKFVIKTPANPNIVKPKSGPASDDEDEEPKESAVHYDWREILYHASNNHAHGYTLEAKFAKLELEVHDQPGPKPVARPSRFLDPKKENTKRAGRMGRAIFGRHGYDDYDDDEFGPHGEGCTCCYSDEGYGSEGYDSAAERLAVLGYRGAGSGAVTGLPETSDSDGEGDEEGDEEEGLRRVKEEDEEMEMSAFDDGEAEEAMRGVVKAEDTEEDEDGFVVGSDA